MATFTRVNPGDLVQSWQVDQILDAWLGAVGKGVPIVDTQVNDPTSYACTIQNIEPTNSRALNVLKADNTTLIRADANGVYLGAPLTMPNGSVTSATIADGTIQTVDLADGIVTNAKLGPDVQRYGNQLLNGGLEVWQRGTGAFTTSNTFTADRWRMVMAGTDTLSVQQGGDVDLGSLYCADFVYNHGSGNLSYLEQKLESVGTLRGLTVTLSGRVSSGTAGCCRLQMYADTNNGGGAGSVSASSAYNAGGFTYTTLTCTMTVPSGANYMRVWLVFDAGISGNCSLDNVNLIVGTQPSNYLQVPIANELPPCMRYYEIIGNSGGEIIFSGYASAGGQTFYWPLPYKAEKAVTPTLTKVGTWATNNCGQPTIDGQTTRAGRLNVQPTAAGTFYTNNQPIPSWITVEANP